MLSSRDCCHLLKTHLARRTYNERGIVATAYMKPTLNLRFSLALLLLLLLLVLFKIIGKCNFRSPTVNCANLTLLQLDFKF